MISFKQKVNKVHKYQFEKLNKYFFCKIFFLFCKLTNNKNKLLLLKIEFY